MSNFVKVTSIDEIPLGMMKVFEIDHRNIVICHNEDGYYALADECSHDSAPISTGSIKGNEIICPRHGAKFNIKTGEVKGPPAVVGIESFKIKVDNNNIYVLLD